jgi:hypothetical protein
MSLKQRLLRMLVAWASLGVFMGVSTPNKLPVVLLIVPFVLLFVACYSTWGLLLQVRTRYFARTKPPRRLGVVVCMSVVLLLILQSLGQLTLRDIVTVAGIVLLGYLYAGRLNFDLPKRMS